MRPRLREFGRTVHSDDGRFLEQAAPFRQQRLHVLVLVDPTMVEFKVGFVHVFNALDVAAGPLIVSEKCDPDAAWFLVEGNRPPQERQEVSELRFRDADLEVQHDKGAIHTARVGGSPTERRVGFPTSRTVHPSANAPPAMPTPWEQMAIQSPQGTHEP